MTLPSVLLVNKFLYPRGGADIYALRLHDLLASRGHRVRLFGCAHPRNVVPDRGLPGQVTFRGTLSERLRFAARALLGTGVAHPFRASLDTFSPDIIHAHQLHSYLSPLVLRIAHSRGIPTVWTLHDYKLICPRYDLLCHHRPCTHALPCTLGVLAHRCMKDSLSASIAAMLESMRWNFSSMLRHTDAFIAPSRFLADIMVRAGMPARSIHLIPNPVPPIDAIDSLPPTEHDYYTYVGRLSHEKGLETLIHAAAPLPYTLRIVGDGPMRTQLQHLAAHSPNIQFLGPVTPRRAIDILARARLSVTPSVWYENSPLSVIESLAVGTPVVVTPIGGLPELVTPHSGIISADLSADSLAQAIHRAMTRTWDRNAIAREAHRRHSLDSHYRALLALYRSLL